MSGKSSDGMTSALDTFLEPRDQVLTHIHYSLFTEDPGASIKRDQEFNICVVAWIALGLAIVTYCPVSLFGIPRRPRFRANVSPSSNTIQISFKCAAKGSDFGANAHCRFFNFREPSWFVSIHQNAGKRNVWKSEVSGTYFDARAGTFNVTNPSNC